MDFLFTIHDSLFTETGNFPKEPEFPVSRLTKAFFADSITEFFPERISALFEDRSVKNYRFISIGYRFFEPGGGELARVPMWEERAATGSLCPLKGISGRKDPATRGRSEELIHADIEPVG